jgi:hypothetical protein
MIRIGLTDLKYTQSDCENHVFIESSVFGLFRNSVYVAGHVFRPQVLARLDDSRVVSRSICVSASVEVISGGFYRDLFGLKALAFERGSRLVHIEGRGFSFYTLDSIFIPASLPLISTDQFNFCEFSCVTFEILSGLLRIAESAFSYCSSLRFIQIPNSVRELSARCFSSCRMLTSVSFEESSVLTRIGTSAFSFCTSLNAISIPASVEILEDLCFSSCSSLSNVIFGSSSKLTRIGGEVFTGCSLQTLSLPASLNKISGSSLTGLTTVEIEDGSTSFQVDGDCLLDFEGKSIVRYFGTDSQFMIGRWVEVIGRAAFLGCEFLRNLAFERPSALARIEKSAFCGCNELVSICIPASVTEIAGAAFACSGISRISVEEGNGTFRVFGDFLCSFPFSLVRYFGLAKSVVIPAHIEILAGYSFTSCTELENVEFESGSKIREVGKAAFSECSSLKSIVFPGSVEMIGACAFFDCDRLETIVFETPSELHTISATALSYCIRLANLVLPAPLDEIGEKVFGDIPYMVGSREKVIHVVDSVRSSGGTD